MFINDPPPTQIYCSYVPSRRKEPYKYYNKIGSAKASVILTINNGIPRGGSVFEYKDGKWEIVYQHYPNNICTICEQPIPDLWLATKDNPIERDIKKRRWRHSATHIGRGLVCEPPPQQKLEL